MRGLGPAEGERYNFIAEDVSMLDKSAYLTTVGKSSAVKGSDAQKHAAQAKRPVTEKSVTKVLLISVK